MAADIPDQLVLKRHRDLQGLGHRVWIRRSLLAALGLFLVAGLFNVYGQRPHGDTVASGAAKLELYAPSRLRSGVLYNARITIFARDDLKSAALLLSPGWAESMQINTIEPSPVSEGSRGGDFLFTLGHIPKGHVYRLFMGFQVNPTNVGSRRADVALYDGDTRLLRVRHTITVFP